MSTCNAPTEVGQKAGSQKCFLSDTIHRVKIVPTITKVKMGAHPKILEVKWLCWHVLHKKGAQYLHQSTAISYWWFVWGLVENTTTVPIWHLQVSSHSPFEMPLFSALFSLCGPWLCAHFHWNSDWSHCGAPFVSRLTTDIWTLQLPNFQSYSRGTKESRRLTVQESLSIMLGSRSLTWRQ